MTASTEVSSTSKLTSTSIKHCISGEDGPVVYGVMVP